MRKNTFFTILMTCCFASFFLVSCEEENIDQTILEPTYLCDSLEMNIGDSCEVTFNGVVYNGHLVEGCKCEGIDNILDSIQQYCLVFNAYIGASCTDSISGKTGFINEYCNCIIDETVDSTWCESLSAYYGETCIDTAGNSGFIGYNCECIAGDFTSYCTIFDAYVGEICTDYITGKTGNINEYCNCIIDETVDSTVCEYIGITCYDEVGNEGIVDTNCECVVWDTVIDSSYCPVFGAYAGGICTDSITGHTGYIDEVCDCIIIDESSTDSSWCENLQLMTGDSCMLFNGTYGIVQESCKCE